MPAKSRTQILALYKMILKEAKRMPIYNFRRYTLRRVKDRFRENRCETDEAKIAKHIKHAEDSLQLIRRQAIIQLLYGADKLALEKLS